MFALTKENKVIHIRDALKGVTYFCCDCGSELFVKHGDIRIKHYSHPPSNCKSTGESLTHRYWKEHIANLKTIQLPTVDFSQDKKSIDSVIGKCQIGSYGLNTGDGYV